MEAYNNRSHLDWGKAEPGGWAAWSARHSERVMHVFWGNCIAFTNARSCRWRVDFLCYWEVMLAYKIATEGIIGVPGFLLSSLPGICIHCGGCEGMAQEHCQSVWLAEHSASYLYKLLCCHLLLAVHFPGLAVLPSLAVLVQLLPWPGTNLLSSAAASPLPPVSCSLLAHCSGAHYSSSCFQPHPWETLSGFSPLVPHPARCLWCTPK